MILNGKAVLHAEHTATRISAASFLEAHSESYGQSTERIRKAFLELWCTIYTGYPKRLKTDQGSVFTSKKWKRITENTGIELRLYGIRAHNSLCPGK